MRPLLIALATALLFTAPAAAVDTTKELRGSLTALSATAVTVKDGSKSATCSVATTSPPLVEYHVGDRVTIVCKRTGDRWRLTSIHKVVTTPKTDEPTSTFTQGGTLTAVSATSVTVHDGDRDFACKLGDASPALDGFHVGDHVVIACKNGVLAGITPVTVPVAPKDPPTTTTPPPPAPPVVERSGQGTLSAISASITSVTTVTVHTDGGDVTCSLGDGSPKLVDVHVGDTVKFGCKNGVLSAISRVSVTPTPTPTPTPTTPTPTPTTPTPTPVYRSGQGTLTSIRGDGMTVRTDGGDVSCAVRDSSPKLGDFHVGDRVKFSCTNEVLTSIARL